MHLAPPARAGPVPRRQSSPRAGIAERTVVSGQNLTRRFGQKVALDDVQFDVCSGELHALLGPNGAGKTTLIRILLGLVEATEGSVELLGRDVRRYAAELRTTAVSSPRVGPLVLPALGALENLVSALARHG